jgi:hypothetical protein
LPLDSVPVTKEGGKVVIDEHPSASWLASWKRAALGAAAHLLGVHLEKGRCFGERQRLHGREGVDESARHLRWPDAESVDRPRQRERDDFRLRSIESLGRRDGLSRVASG